MSYRRYLVNHTQKTATLLFKTMGGECYQYDNELFDEFLKDSFHGNDIELLKEDVFPPSDYYRYQSSTSSPTSRPHPSPE